MSETVKKGGRELRLAGDMGPLSEGEVGGDDDPQTPLVALGILWRVPDVLRLPAS